MSSAVGLPESGPAKEREEARELVGATRRFLERRGRRVSPAASAEAKAAAAELECAIESGDPDRLIAANARLAAVWKDHLALAARKTTIRELLESALVAVLVALALRALVVEPFKIPSASMVPTLLVGDHIAISKLSYGLRMPFADRWIVRWSEPRRGDVVVFASPSEAGRDYVKRVVGLPGDVIELRNQVVHVNGVPQPRKPGGELSYDAQNELTGAWRTERCTAWTETLLSGPIEGPRATRPADLAEAYDAAVAGGSVEHQVLQCVRGRVGEREGPFERVAPGHVFVLGDNRDRSADSRSGGGWQVPISHVKGKAALVWWSWGASGWSPWNAKAGVRADRLFKRIE